MKRFQARVFVVAMGLVLALYSHGQTPAWWRHFGNQGWSEGLDLAVDGAGCIYGIGKAESATLGVDGITAMVRGNMDILLTKWDSTGQVRWVKTAGGDYQFPTDWDAGDHVRFDVSSNHLLTSGRYGSSPTYFDKHVLSGGSANDEADMFIAAYDTAGHCLWVKGALGYRVSAKELLIDAASTIHVFGNAKVAGVSFQETPVVSLPAGGFLANYAANGALLSADRVLLNGGIGDAQWLGDDWVIGGSAQNGAQLFDIAIPVSTAKSSFVARTDTAGNVDWVTTFRSDHDTEVWDVQVSTTGQILCSGFFVEDLIIGDDTLSGPPVMYSAFFAILGSDGTVEHVVKVGSPTEVYVTDLKPGADGEAYLFGQYRDRLELGDTIFPATASRDAFVVRFNAEAQPIAAMHFGRTPSSEGSVLPTAAGLYFSCTYDSSMAVGNIEVPLTSTGWDIFLAKFDSLSGFTGIAEERMAQGGELHIYANPNNGLCTIDLPPALKNRNGLTLSIFDQEGRVVQRTPLTFTSSGVQLDIRAQAKGIYHVELTDSTQRYSGSIVFE